LDSAGAPIGIEIIGASRILGNVIEPLKRYGALSPSIYLQGNLQGLKALLQSDGEGDYKEYGGLRLVDTMTEASKFDYFSNGPQFFKAMLNVTEDSPESSTISIVQQLVTTLELPGRGH
jgi:hypothetical protein